MKDILRYVVVMVFSFGISSCKFFPVWQGGTHGSIVSYSYNVSKDSLEAAVGLLIEHEESLRKIPLDGDSGTYVKISISKSDFIHLVVFRYAGDEDYWLSHPNDAHISVTAVKQEGSDYKNEHEMTPTEKSQAIAIFQEGVIDKLQVEMGLNPIEKPN